MYNSKVASLQWNQKVKKDMYVEKEVCKLCSRVKGEKY